MGKEELINDRNLDNLKLWMEEKGKNKLEDISAWEDDGS